VLMAPSWRQRRTASGKATRSADGTRMRIGYTSSKPLARSLHAAPRCSRSHGVVDGSHALSRPLTLSLSRPLTLARSRPLTLARSLSNTHRFGSAGLHTLMATPDQQLLSGSRDKDGDEVNAQRSG
jgi:hypothetical protein